MDRPLRVAVAGTGFIGRIHARAAALGSPSRAFADTYAAVRGDEPEGLPRFGDGRRAARITEAVLESAASHRWEEVPA